MNYSAVPQTHHVCSTPLLVLTYTSSVLTKWSAL